MNLLCVNLTFVAFIILSLFIGYHIGYRKGFAAGVRKMAEELHKKICEEIDNGRIRAVKKSDKLNNE